MIQVLKEAHAKLERQTVKQGNVALRNDAQASVTWIIKHMKAMETQNTRRINPIQNQGIDERFESIEKKLAEISDSIKSLNRSYAEVAQQATQQTTSSTSNIFRQSTIQEIKEKRQKHDVELKRERAKLEVTLTMENATDDEKKSISTATPQEITARGQTTITQAKIPESKPQTMRHNHNENGNIRIQYENEEEAKRLENIE